MKHLPVALALATALVPAAARAGDSGRKAQCLSSYEQAQQRRLDARLREAREQLLVCSQQDCPDVIKADCVPWLAEVEKAMPTIVLAVRDADGRDVQGVTVFIDGALVEGAAEGQPVPVDPGARLIRVETKDGRAAEERIVARAGEKLRPVTVALAARAGAPAPGPAAPAPAQEAPSASERGGVPALSWGLAAVGVAGLGAATFFGLRAQSGEDDLRGTCAPTCSPSRIDAVERDLLLSDVGLAVGVAGLAAAVVVYVTRGSSGKPSAARLLPGGRGVAVRF